MSQDKCKYKYVLTQEDLDHVAEVAVKAYRAEQRKTEKNRAREKTTRTKKMLSSYRRLKKSLTEEVEFTEDEKVELRWKFIEDLMGDPTRIANRSEDIIKDEEHRRQKDAYCVKRIEKAVRLFREECENSANEETKRRFREFSMMYMDEEEKTVLEIAEAEGVTEKTVYRDLGICNAAVATYLLGV